jgi:hypothetical protein
MERGFKVRQYNIERIANNPAMQRALLESDAEARNSLMMDPLRVVEVLDREANWATDIIRRKKDGLYPFKG